MAKRVNGTFASEGGALSVITQERKMSRNAGGALHFPIVLGISVGTNQSITVL